MVKLYSYIAGQISVGCCCYLSGNYARNRSPFSSQFGISKTKTLYFMVVRSWLVCWLNYREISVDWWEAKIVDALRYNPEGRGLIPHGVVEVFRSIYNSDFAIDLGFLQTLIKRRTRHMSSESRVWVRRYNSFPSWYADFPQNLEDLTSWNPMGFSRPVKW